MATLILRIFSGLPNPEWTLTKGQHEECVSRLNVIKNQGELITIPLTKPAFGYNGFVIMMGDYFIEVYNGIIRSLNLELMAQTGQAPPVYEDKRREFEKWVYSLIPEGAVHKEVYEEIEESIEQEKVDDHSLFYKAIKFAAIKHAHQFRQNMKKEPYIVHPIGVAEILSCEAGVNDNRCLAAAVLHDTLEDTDTTMEELEKEFGVSVSKIVHECTDDANLTKKERKRKQIESGPTKSHNAKLVKLADKLHNLRDMLICPRDDWDLEKTQEYFSWCKEVVDGMRDTSEVLENKLDSIFNGTFMFKGQEYPCIAKKE